MWRSTRQAWRRLIRRPAFTAAAVVTLGLGIGASTATFSLVRGILLRALPVPQPERVVFITRSGDVSIPDGADWRAAAPSLGSLALFLRDWSVDLIGPNEPVRLSGYVVEPEYFRVLGVEPLIGRLLDDSDNRPGAVRVTVISEALWRDSFAADPAVLGRVVRLSDHPTTVVGVMPARADVLGDRAAFWLPVATETPWALNERGTNTFDAMGRLAPGATLAAAQAELRTICERLEREYPQTNRGKIVRPLYLLDFLVGGVRRGLWVLFGGVALVVLIACTNLASLLLARAAARRREMALRAALGAGRTELAVDTLSEGLLLALLGGVLGVALAAAAGPLLARLAPTDLPRATNVGIDAAVLAFGGGMAVLCGLLCGLAPAWRALRTAPAAALQEGGKGSVTASDRRRARDLVVAAEVAVAFVLLFGAQQLIRSFLNLSAAPLGFDPRGVLTAELVLPEARYSEREAQTRAFRGVVEALRAIPGVEASSSVIGAPLRPAGRGIGASLDVDGYLPPAGTQPSARVRPAMGDYFGTIRAPFRQGRPWAASDGEHTAPVVVVNERFVATYWPGQAVVGKRLRFSGWDDDRWFTVVGVVADTKTADLGDDDTRAIYLPYAQRGPSWQRFGTLLLRTSGDPETLRRAMTQAVWSVDPTLTLANLETLEWRHAQSAAQPRFLAQLLGAFALAAVFLVAQGLYGLLAYLASTRRREVGVRMALGVTARGIALAIAAQGLTATVAGALVGVGLALALRRFLGSLLYGVAAVDAWAVAGSFAVLLVAGVMATFGPALRAARVDPMVALREE